MSAAILHLWRCRDTGDGGRGTEPPHAGLGAWNRLTGETKRAAPKDGPRAAARPGSDEELAAVGRDGRTGDEAGIVRGEEDDERRDLLGLAEPADGDLRR